MNSKPFARDIAHPLNDDQVVTYYDKAQRLETQADELARQLKEDTKGQKAAIDKLRVDARRFRHTASTREELRSVQCMEEVRGSQVVVVRMDDGTVIDQRALDPGEQIDAFPGLDKTSADDPLPLEPDYTPSDTSPKAPTEEPPKKGRKRR